jgi:conjugal transfer pilin signal peptidase TrbI
MNASMPFGSSAAALLGWWVCGVRLLCADLKRRWVLFAAVGAIWALALIRLFVHPMPVIPLLFNWTPSLPYHVVLIDRGSQSLARGDLIVYAFAGEAAEKDYPGLMRQAFFKRIAGVAGDSVTVKDRDIFINGVHVGRAKTHTFDRRPLEPIAPTVIPQGFLYAQGTGADSFDSRYRSSGLVAVRDVAAKVRPLF